MIGVFSASFLQFHFHYALRANKVLQPRQRTDMRQGTLLLLSLQRVFPDTPAGIAGRSQSLWAPESRSHTHINTHIDTHSAITAACWNFLGLLVMRHSFPVPPIEDSVSSRHTLSDAMCHKTCASDRPTRTRMHTHHKIPGQNGKKAVKINISDGQSCL